MRTLMLTSVALTLAFVAAPLRASPKDKDESGPPGLRKKDWVPPGLEKKGGLPPGQAKKLDKQQKGQEDRDADANDGEAPAAPPATPTNIPVVADPTKPPEPKVDRTPGVTVPPPPPPTTSGTTAPKTTTGPGVTTPTVDPAQARAKLELQVRSLNRLDSNRAAAAAGWNHVVQHGGVPYTTIQQQRKAFPELSPAGALLGNLVSQQGGVPFSKVRAERTKGKQWGVLAEQYKVPVESLSQAVSGLEKAMQDAVPGSRSDTTDVPAVAIPTVDAVQAKAILEQQVRTLSNLDNNRAAAAAGWNYVMQHAGVTYTTIQQQRKAFPDLSPAGALLGNLVSQQGGVPFNKVRADRIKGKQWGVLAEQYMVPVESLSQAVSGLEKAMRDAATAATKR